MKQTIHQLTESSWGAQPHTLRTTAMALCLSTGTHPVWAKSTQKNKNKLI